MDDRLPSGGLTDGLQKYRTQSLDHPTQTWLDGWIAHTQYRVSTAMLAPLIDSVDDWGPLRDKITAAMRSYDLLTLNTEQV